MHISYMLLHQSRFTVLLEQLDIITLHDKLTRFPLFHLKSVMLDHIIAKK